MNSLRAVMHPLAELREQPAEVAALPEIQHVGEHVELGARGLAGFEAGVETVMRGR